MVHHEGILAVRREGEGSGRPAVRLEVEGGRRGGHAPRVRDPRRRWWPPRQGTHRVWAVRGGEGGRRGGASHAGVEKRGQGVGEAKAAEVLTYLRGKTRGQGRAAAADAIVEATRMDGEGQGGPTRQPHR